MEGVFFMLFFCLPVILYLSLEIISPFFVIFFGLKNRILSEEIKQNKSL